MKLGDKKGQLTIFIILGLVVVSIVALFFFMNSSNSQFNPKKNPEFFIEQCIQASLEKVIPPILEKGGYYLDPPIFLVYQNTKIAYHCFTSEKREICLRNDALSIPRFEEEIKEAMLSDVDDCFDKLQQSFNSVDISFGSTNFSVKIIPERIAINVIKEVIINRDSFKEEYSSFQVDYPASLFDFIKISNEILNQEVSCNCPQESCTADTLELMKRYQDYKITFFRGSNDETVYSLEDYFNQNKFNIAVKNCDKTP